MKGNRDEALYFFQDGSYSNQGALSYKPKNPSSKIITDELAVDDVDGQPLEEKTAKLPAKTKVVKPYVGTSSFNFEDFKFFNLLLNDDGGNSSLDDLSSSIMRSLNLTESDVTAAVNEINL